MASNYLELEADFQPIYLKTDSNTLKLTCVNKIRKNLYILRKIVNIES